MADTAKGTEPANALISYNDGAFTASETFADDEVDDVTPDKSNDSTTALIASLLKGSWDEVRTLLDCGTPSDLSSAVILNEAGSTVYHMLDYKIVPVDITARLVQDPLFGSVDFEGSSPLHGIDTFSESIGLPGLINSQNVEGLTPLHLALREGLFKVAATLLEHGASIDVEDQLQNTPLNYLRPDVASDADTSFVAALLPSLTDEQKHHENIFGRRPLLDWPSLSSNGSLETIATRLDLVELARRDHLGNTALHVAAGAYDYKVNNKTADLCYQPRCLHVFFDSQISAQLYCERNIFGRTPLHELVCQPITNSITTIMACRNAQMAITVGDGRGRNLWHLIFLYDIFSNISDLQGCMKEFGDGQLQQRIDALSRDRNSWIASRCYYYGDGCTARDSVGRTPLHYAAMLATAGQQLHAFDEFVVYFFGVDCLRVQDNYGRTPLHYAAIYGHKLPPKLRRILPKGVIDDDCRDIDGFTWKDILSATKRVTSHLIDVPCAYLIDSCQWLKCFFLEIGLCSDSKLLYNDESAQRSWWSLYAGRIDAWKVWIDYSRQCIYSGRYKAKYALLIREAVLSFMHRLLTAIGEEDPRLAGKLIEVGSAYEKTKLDLSDEFDFTVQLTELSKFCEVQFPNDCPVGFCTLKKSPYGGISRKQRNSFKDFFDENNVLKTTTVQFWFQRTLLKVLSWQKFWDDEPLLELCYHIPESETYCNDLQRNYYKLVKKFDDVAGFCRLTPSKMGKNVFLKFNRPINGTFVLHPISLDIVPAVHIVGWLPPETRQGVNSDGCNLVFNQPYQSLRLPYSPVQYANISFARAESLLLRDGPSIVRAAYVVAKLIFHYFASAGELFDCSASVTSHVIKMASLWTISDETNSRTDGIFSAAELREQVQKLFQKMFEFSLVDYVPSYFAPTIHFPVWEYEWFPGYSHEFLRKSSLTFENLILGDRTSPPDSSEMSQTIKTELLSMYALFAAVSTVDDYQEFVLPQLN